MLLRRACTTSGVTHNNPQQPAKVMLSYTHNNLLKLYYYSIIYTQQPTQAAAVTRLWSQDVARVCGGGGLATSVFTLCRKDHSANKEVTADTPGVELIPMSSNVDGLLWCRFSNCSTFHVCTQFWLDTGNWMMCPLSQHTVGRMTWQFR